MGQNETPSPASGRKPTKAEIYAQLAAQARTRKQLTPAKVASVVPAATPASVMTPEPASATTASAAPATLPTEGALERTPNRGEATVRDATHAEAKQFIEKLAVELRAKGADDTSTQRNAVAFVQELLLEKSRLSLRLSEASEAASEARRLAASCAEPSAAAEISALRTALETARGEAREAAELSQQLKQAVGGLQEDLSKRYEERLMAAEERVIELQEKLHAQQDAAKTALQRLAQREGELEKISTELEAQGEAAAAARRAASDAAAEACAAREEAGSLAALLAERDAALASAEEALSVLAPDAVAAAQQGCAFPAAAAPSGAPAVQTALALREQGAAVDGEDRPLAELIAEWTIEGAKSDSVLTNPALGIAAVIDYVNEWRDALRDFTGGDAPNAVTVVTTIKDTAATDAERV